MYPGWYQEGREGPMEFILKHEKVWKRVGIIGGVYLGMKYLVPLLIPFLVAALTAYWLRPCFLRMEKWFRIKPAVSAGIFLLLAAAGVGLALYFLGSQLWALAGRFFAQEETEIYLEQALYNCCQAAERMLGFPAERMQQTVMTQVRVMVQDMKGTWMPKAMNGSFTLVKGVGKSVAAVLITAISFVLWSGDFEKIKEEAEGSALWQQLVRLARGILEAVGGYLKAQCIIIAIIMGTCSVGFFLAGSSYALLFGICTGLLDALPVLGTGIVLAPSILVSVIQRDYQAALILAVTYGVCTLVREVLEPRLVGKRLGLFPILVLMSVYVGVQVYGVGGIVLGPLSVLVIQELWREME
ncbi:MAG: AI-2E family transporter [Lachnospiraceae bacterium]|jgi:sporulation integral membrane protein YtvI|nr:AI-2E family transporter [Lachnospiraceae bacterium]MCI9133453.1 AI-2E family transporter [Lachnospiraceae bacterium]